MTMTLEKLAVLLIIGGGLFGAIVGAGHPICRSVFDRAVVAVACAWIGASLVACTVGLMFGAYAGIRFVVAG